MKNILIAGVICTLLLFSFSCKTNNSNPQDTAITIEDTVKTESDLLLSYLAETGDYVNSRQFPSMIKAPTVYENLGKNMVVIDMRSKEDFVKGHIKGSVNIPFQDLPVYFETGIKPFQFEKIVLVCEHGQRSSYASCLLRLMGYGNVYSMRWGMAAWNSKLAKDNAWDKIASGKFESLLDTTTVQKPSPSPWAVINTGKATGEEILKERVRALFKEDLQYIMLNADQAFAMKDSMFIINYDRRDKYESGHIPGAVRYKPGGFLGLKNEMKTVPPSQPVLIYCETGHNSAFAAAYLRLFGYKAHSLSKGGISFMHEKMNRERNLSWNTFTADQAHDYPVVK